MSGAKDALIFWETEIGKKKEKTVLSYAEYLEQVRQGPERVLRNIFQLFYDMVMLYVGEGVNEYPEDPESIGFVKYDCSRLLVEGADTPFLADRPFANRFMDQIRGLRQGFQQNRIYAYDGPSGCGKSTFLNNLLRSFEAYAGTTDGQIFEILWEIDENLSSESGRGQKLVLPCPSHDYPILIIPKEYRAGFLGKLLPEGTAIREKIFRAKEYEWLFQGEVCTICKSIFGALLEKLGNLDRVLGMVKAKVYRFDRRVGEGISIFNPGDKPVKDNFNNAQIQRKLDKIFGIDVVRYTFSLLARTNNGIYVLMDIKGNNEDRMLELHNVISEGVHKVGDIEEQITSLFFALMNPEDKRIITDKKMESFAGRIKYNKLPFVLEPATEANIYRNVFGDAVDEAFLPRIMKNFARAIIASRMHIDCKPLKEWIPNMGSYKRFCDENGLLLRMEIYGGIIPDWLSEDDRKKFTAPVRRALIAEGPNEGDHGFDGRESIEMFREFLSRYGGRASLINMDNLMDFFKYRIDKERRDRDIPKNFLASLVDSYDYTVLSEVKEALYFYNEEQVSKDVLNYLCAINYEPGSKIKCEYTGEEMEVTIDFLKLMASRLSGRQMTDQEALRYAQDTQRKYITVVVRERAKITDTDLYRDLCNAYKRNLKEKVLQPFVGNDNFRGAIIAYNTRGFDTFDTRIREHVSRMMKNLMVKLKPGYTEQGAKEICLYVLDRKLTEKFN